MDPVTASGSRSSVLKRVGSTSLAVALGAALGWTAARWHGRPESSPPLGGPASAPSWTHGDAGERFAQIESHLRGLDVAMAEIGYRYAELFFAVQDRNWDYADYQMGKIELVLRLAIVRRPRRAASTNAFLNDDWPAVLAGVRTRTPAPAAQALRRLRTACMKCHVSEQVPYFTVHTPEHRLASIRPTED